jgi:hypothetical protein
MTEAEAIKFLQKCERYWLWQKNLAPTQIFAKTWNGCLSAMTSAPCLLIRGVFHIFENRWDCLDTIALAYVVLVFGVASWLLLRLKEVRRVMNQDFAGSSRLSGSR